VKRSYIENGLYVRLKGNPWNSTQPSTFTLAWHKHGSLIACLNAHLTPETNNKRLLLLDNGQIIHLESRQKGWYLHQGALCECGRWVIGLSSRVSASPLLSCHRCAGLHYSSQLRTYRRGTERDCLVDPAGWLAQRFEAGADVGETMRVYESVRRRMLGPFADC